MANNLGSNVTRKVMEVFLDAFEANRVLTKTIDTQLFQGKFTPHSGATVDIKRPHDYKSIRTSDGDLTSETKSDIISGKATATVEDYFTVAAEWGDLEEALHLGQLDKILAPMATRMVTDLETSLAEYMMINCGLAYGSVGTAIDAWGDIAGAGSFLQTLGVPMDRDWFYVANPFVIQSLASSQATAIAPASGSLVQTAWEKATIANNVGGMRVMSSNALATRTNPTSNDLAGALNAAPTLTYVAAKDSMTQTWVLKSLVNSFTIPAGTVLEVASKYHCSLSTRLPVFNAAGDQIKFRGVVTQDATITSGDGSVIVAGAGLWETNGAYNTTTTALATNDVVNILGTTAVNYQPALFYHPQAFSMATVKLSKLAATDTTATTPDGISLRVTKYSDGDKNKQMVRVDLLPAFGVLNPFFAGQGYGVA